MDSVPKSFNPHKRLKEEFVSNLTGSSMQEIAAITTIIPVLFLLRRAIGFNFVLTAYFVNNLSGLLHCPCFRLRDCELK